MSKVMNINTGQMETLEHFKKNGKAIQSNKLVLILLNKKPGVAVKCSLFSQHSVLGLAADPSIWMMPVPCKHGSLQSLAAPEWPLYLDGSGLLWQGKKTASF